MPPVVNRSHVGVLTLSIPAFIRKTSKVVTTNQNPNDYLNMYSTNKERSSQAKI